MTTWVRAPEAARRLGVTTETLYSYVSRGRVHRTLGSDGRSSLFDVAELDALAAASSRPTRPPSTIDVRISTCITQLDEAGIRYRGVSLDDLVDEPFERVCDLLWHGSLGDLTGCALRSLPPAAPCGAPTSVISLIRLATDIDAGSTPTETAVRFLDAIAPRSFPTEDRSSFAARLTRRWVDDPSPALVRAVNSTLVLLADHELATSTLSVRVATSVRASPAASLIAGLATVEGDLHGAASFHVHRMFERIEAAGPERVLTDHRRRREPVPGFGHKIYRDRDPRFSLLLDRVRDLPDPHDRRGVVDDTVRAAGALVGRLANVDLALGALTYVAGLPPGAPLFAVARVAGWTAHHLEELEERPLRFRGLAR
ncbi:MAG: citrate/2-methylcitrate synthase [Ilumatobacter sp.]|uniref:citrate/2-methylcitrate synthase n=1 Tax=Ilumatobacter sp. TaxID=1967498 RepID=UPI003297D8D2